MDRHGRSRIGLLDEDNRKQTVAAPIYVKTGNDTSEKEFRAEWKSSISVSCYSNRKNT
jgi:hypothetical protein